jgi:hypothetical protein
VDSGARKRLLTKLRVHDGLLVANMVEDHHEGVLHPCGLRARPLARPAGVMTTTLCAKAHSRAATDRCEHYGRGERARCASLEQQGRIVPATGTAVVCPLPRRRVGCRVSPTPVERVVLVAVDTSQVVGLVHA